MSEVSANRPVLVAMTGATGAIYGIRLLEVLRELGVETHLVVTRWAEATIKTETDRRVDDVRALGSVVHDEHDVAAPPASSDFATAGMVVAPCSMRTLAAVANGLEDNLVQRAAAVHLQEHRRLVLLARESPLSVIHLDNMLRVAKAGAVVAPPVPAFYAKLGTLDDMVDHTVGRALDLLGLEHGGIRRWGERRPALRPVRSDDA
jgi:polyprenyl P-hydroxybenzoate/phenylacrylic acid decarboxylase-like protein